MFLKENTIAIIPHLGYRKTANQSHCAYQWLAYAAHQDNVPIQHGRNEGEKRVGPVFVKLPIKLMNFTDVFIMFVSNVFLAPP